MANVFDVADHILNELGSASTMKLQKLVYYGQAYHLVRFGEPLFPDEIQAWANGPVVPNLFDAHRNEFVIKRGFFSSRTRGTLTLQDARTLDHVITCLGHSSGAELSNLTHNEEPWLKARRGVPEGARSNKPITLDSILSFYSSPHCDNPVFAQ